MVRIRVRPGFWLAAGLALLVLPLPWITALVISSAVHECSHLAALRLTGVSVYAMDLGPGGAALETGEVTPFQGMVSAVAGPIGPALLLFLVRWMPRTALCALIQGCYHLLPVRPLDGGRALEWLTAYLGWDRRICSAVEWAVLPALAYLGITMAMMGAGLLPVLLCAAVIFRVFLEKLLANRRGNEYNRCTKP